MLLFRGEEHIGRWRRQWSQPHGATMTLAAAWGLARAWYGVPRNRPEWRRYTVEEAKRVFAGLGLTGEFWSLRD